MGSAVATKAARSLDVRGGGGDFVSVGNVTSCYERYANAGDGCSTLAPLSAASNGAAAAFPAQSLQVRRIVRFRAASVDFSPARIISLCRKLAVEEKIRGRPGG